MVYFTRSGVIKTDKNTDATTSASLNAGDSGFVGNTEKVAKMIQQKTGADLYQIYTERYYPSSFMGTALKAWLEEKTDARPKLANPLESLDDYDVIYVGYPIWWYTAPMAVGTFLESYDLTGKTIVPFCTSQDNSIDKSMEFINRFSKKATVLEGITANNVSENEIEQWLKRIGNIE